MTDLELVTRFLDALRTVEEEIPEVFSGGYVDEPDASAGGATIDGWWTVAQLAHVLRSIDERTL